MGALEAAIQQNGHKRNPVDDLAAVKRAHKDEVVKVVIPAIEKELIHVRIKGVTSLICNHFSKKAVEMILNSGKMRPGGKATTKKREPRDPEKLFMDSLYPMDEKNKYGFPGNAFKLAAVSACRQLDNVHMTFARGAFFVPDELVEIKGKPTMRVDRVVVGQQKTDIRYRAEFKEWSATLPVIYNKGSIDKSQVINLINLGGFSVGVGEWRPERNGNHGMFEVVAGK